MDLGYDTTKGNDKTLTREERKQRRNDKRRTASFHRRRRASGAHTLSSSSGHERRSSGGGVDGDNNNSRRSPRRRRSCSLNLRRVTLTENELNHLIPDAPAPPGRRTSRAAGGGDIESQPQQHPQRSLSPKRSSSLANLSQMSSFATNGGGRSAFNNSFQGAMKLTDDSILDNHDVMQLMNDDSEATPVPHDVATRELQDIRQSVRETQSIRLQRMSTVEKSPVGSPTSSSPSNKPTLDTINATEDDLTLMDMFFKSIYSSSATDGDDLMKKPAGYYNTASSNTNQRRNRFFFWLLVYTLVIGTAIGIIYWAMNSSSNKRVVVAQSPQAQSVGAGGGLRNSQTNNNNNLLGNNLPEPEPEPEQKEEEAEAKDVEEQGVSQEGPDDAPSTVQSIIGAATTAGKKFAADGLSNSLNKITGKNHPQEGAEEEEEEEEGDIKEGPDDASPNTEGEEIPVEKEGEELEVSEDLAGVDKANPTTTSTEEEEEEEAAPVSVEEVATGESKPVGDEMELEFATQQAVASLQEEKKEKLQEAKSDELTAEQKKELLEEADLLEEMIENEKDQDNVLAELEEAIEEGDEEEADALEKEAKLLEKEETNVEKQMDLLDQMAYGGDGETEEEREELENQKESLEAKEVEMLEEEESLVEEEEKEEGNQ